MRRREFLAGAALVAANPRVALGQARPPDGPVITAPPLTNAEYLALADRIMARLDHTWVRHKQAYSAGTLNVGTIYNAAILTVHATAAEVGHTGGRARNDARARRLVAQLIDKPVFFTGPRGRRGKMYHSPGWLADLELPDAPQDKSIDPKVAEGLVAAYRARDALELDAATIERLTFCVDRVARDSFFRFPNVRLNQFNWNAELYLAAATLTGNPELLRRDYRRQLRRFIRDDRNLGPSYRFNYLPHFPADDPSNLDSAEYANITLHALHAYEPALAVGMTPLPAREIAHLRAWVRRALFGYWTHSGMLNWDTGLGIARWMKAKTWAYALQGLLTIASTPRFHEDPRYGGWAKCIFDRSLALYDTMLTDGNTYAYPSPHLYGATTKHQATGDQRVFSARMAANAARAITLGLGTMPADEPPPFFAYDSDIGRLAVSTPRYATAIVASNRGAFPYGGVEPARLLDGEGHAINLGGRGNAAFGLVIRGPSGRFATQTADRGEIRLVDPRRPGPFEDLRATTRIANEDVTVTATHRFTATAIETTWQLTRKRRVTVDAQFPTARGTTIEAVYGDGRIVRLPPGRAGVRLDGIVRLELGDYTVTLPGLAGGSARALRTTPQATNPRPGPTLAVRLPRTADRLTARISKR
ncbi:hypothetical protein DVA67_028380 [Solirubrobacter sp. CPCC 204708]|uniref:Heparinase II/III-like protein n=1 Tax=Solirubrobacter deserti TaxID=2282478 RepID=A0ABT4RPJ6_9ACTN|nr:hypothetical protein [Solirubrobacter deserti]MBE2319916.1 hypothetical protein [Solirubrobacter deserti]MDA0140490.1 hypothetical protein [Solirubrobacter deserti]